MIEVNLSVAGGKVESVKLRIYDEKKKPNLIRGINRATLIVNRQIRTRKLSGQYLKTPSGTLRASFHTVRAREHKGVGIYGEVASNISYARIHELGFHGIVQVRSHTRRVGKVGRSASSGGSVATMVMVRAHTAKRNVRAKYYARHSLLEKRDNVSKGIIREMTRPLR